MKSSVAPGAVLFSVTSTAAPNSAEAQALVKTLTSMAVPAGYQVHIAGESPPPTISSTNSPPGSLG